MVIDLDRCTACQACSVACMAENNVPFVSQEEAGKERLMQWQRVLANVEGEYPRARAQFIPRPCMHCEPWVSTSRWTISGPATPR